MTYAKPGQTGLDYHLCRYGGSRVAFRGPRRSLRGRYMAFLGGTDTFGRFIETPFVPRLESTLATPAVNLGAINAGLDLYLNEPPVLDIASRAEVTVIQVLGAQNMSNRYYAVHPRRNDRFLKASGLLERLFPEVDFTEFHFTRHLLGRLQRLDESRFALVRQELQHAWLARMKQLTTLVRGPIVLMWFADQRPGQAGLGRLDRDPLFIDAPMLDALSGRVAATLEITPSEAAVAAGVADMVFGDGETEAASEQMNAATHAEAARALAPVLREVMRQTVA
ncbi:DUF6473 family protein [Aestuariicoccus sp. MJ-SS9]|uniref:DUF6473 family protein n=1 Tax=Aestuariicoccus sp. MJ-SS9 TaxID=3079855 RepID=UPI00290AF330|nr:DUF6473 family protein [Aestuariicoccus sp. MJ-SS9]MDU8913905.1 DUF6473 family protein [Aestuariicoccus sp. MJ-SS9]